MEPLTASIRRGGITMFAKALSFGGPLLLVGALVLVTPGSGLAQHHGGGGFNHGGFNHHGFNHHGFNHGGFHHGGFHDRGWWYPGYYGDYGAGPYYYGYYPFEGYSSDSYGGVTSSYPDSYSPATAQPDTSAYVTVSVPADAEIWFNDIKTTSTGAVREYQSTSLTPGTRYTYELRARWNENGHEVAQTQQVEVTAGTRVNVHFPVQPTKAPTAPNH